MPYYTKIQGFRQFTLAKGEGDVGEEFNTVVSSFNAVEADIAALVGDVSALQAGSSPGYGAAIDIRWNLTNVSGTNTIVAIDPSGPVSSDSIPEGHFRFLSPVSTITGATTLNIGTTEGAVDVKKIDGGSYVALSSGDMLDGAWYLLVYDSTQTAWLILLSGGGSAAVFQTEFLTGG